MRLAEFKTRLFIFFAGRLLRWADFFERESDGGQPSPAAIVAGEEPRQPVAPDCGASDGAPGPPEHWVRLVTSTPPQHWLDLIGDRTFEPSPAAVPAEPEPPQAPNQEPGPPVIRVAPDRLPGEKQPPPPKRALKPGQRPHDLGGQTGWLNRLRFQPPAPPRSSALAANEGREATTLRRPDGPAADESPEQPETISLPEQEPASDWRAVRASLKEQPAQPGERSVHYPAQSVRETPAAEQQSEPGSVPATNRLASPSSPGFGEHAARAWSQASRRGDEADVASVPARNTAQQVIAPQKTPKNVLQPLPTEALRRPKQLIWPDIGSNGSRIVRPVIAEQPEREPPRPAQTFQPTPPRRAPVAPAKLSPGKPAASEPGTNYQTAAGYRRSRVSLIPAEPTREFAAEVQTDDHPLETNGELKASLWPALPAGRGFELFDELALTEREGESLRRMGQEQRGILWNA